MTAIGPTELLDQGTVHIVQTMAMGGIETLVLDLMRAGHRNDHCICLEGRVSDLVAAWPSLKALGDRLVSMEKAPGLHPTIIFKLARLLRQLNPRTVVTHHIGPLLYGGMAARLAGVPQLAYYEHDAWHYERVRDRIIVAACSRALRPSHAAVSRQVATRLRTILGASSHVAVIPPGIDTARFVPGDRLEACQRLGLDARRRWIGTVGRLVPVKSQTTLIAALAQLDADIGAVIVGDGPARSTLEAQVERLGLGGRVVMLGQRDDISEILPAFDVFCLPSLNEGLPRSIMEAQACGLPVVASDVGGVTDVVNPKTGSVVPAGDAAALASALHGRLSAKCDSLAAREFVIHRFSIAGVIREFNQLNYRNSERTPPTQPARSLKC